MCLCGSLAFYSGWGRHVHEECQLVARCGEETDSGKFSGMS
jgi:hypothetical protein